ncbi:MAG: glutaredoxin 3 [Patescibacteria group bacterium]|nr:glutaredoxin 3 [Patescibacteria group bacterium]
MNTMNNSVTVYSTPTCHYCTMAKNFFKTHNVPFKDVDVSKSRESAMEMMMKSGQMGVPVVDINSKIIVGFDPNAFTDLLGLKK